MRKLFFFSTGFLCSFGTEKLFLWKLGHLILQLAIRCVQWTHSPRTYNKNPQSLRNLFAVGSSVCDQDIHRSKIFEELHLHGYLDSWLIRGTCDKQVIEYTQVKIQIWEPRPKGSNSGT